MTLSDDERGRIDEDTITVMVGRVRKNDNETAFKFLITYLEYYIKLFGRKYRIPGCDSDEIEQECLFALRYKAIEDFNPDRGRFKSFAILCIKRHLFSLIKGNNQLKRKVLNTSLSLDEDRSEGDDNLSLISLIIEDVPNIDDRLAKDESSEQHKAKLLSKLSDLEQEVLHLYLQQMHYDEIVDALKRKFPGKKISVKGVDNALQRVRIKAQGMSENLEW